MFSFLKRFNIIQISITSLVLFVALVLVLSGYSITKTAIKAADANQDAETLKLVAALEQVAHHHAVERGLTAGYLGAPTAEKLSAINQQRQKADAAVTNVNSMLNGDWPEDFQLSRYVRPLQQHLLSKRQLRQQVDQQQAPGAFVFYSQLNRLALDAARFVNANVSEKQVRDENNAVLLFAQFKERAGQVRGKINGVLARQRLTPETSAEILSYLNDIELVSTYLSSALDESMRNQFQAVVEGNTSRQITSYTDQLLASENPDFASLPTPAVWFPLATEQIVAVKKLLDQQTQAAQQLASDMASSARALLLMFVLGIVVIVSVIVVLNVFIVVNLGKELRELTTTLNKVAQEGDLTLDVRLDSKNELGFISKAIHGTIHSFKDLVVGLAESIDANRRLNDKLIASANKVQDHANATNGLAGNIATSIEQMSATTNEIAQSAARSIESCSELNDSVNSANEMNRQTREAMQQLTQDMSDVATSANEMEGQLTEINGMLATIDSVAEQTNLLALNAAIEAARAGEQGRGFAVVADEVRSLAQSSKQTSDRISELLTGLGDVSQVMIGSIRKTVASADETYERSLETENLATSLNEQAANVETVTTSVAAAAEQQSTVTQEMASDAVKVADAASAEVDAVREMHSISSDLDTNSQTLERTMQGFKIH